MSIQRVKPDSKGRVTLGKISYGVSSYELSVETDGRIILTPYIEIPASEKWLYDNPKALGRVKKGLSDSSAKRLVKKGSFVKYLKD